jgi:hypothetical protein
MDPTYQRKNDHMYDTSRDICFSPESLECHLSQMDSGWWGIYMLVFYPKISLWEQIDLLLSSAITSSNW